MTILSAIISDAYRESNVLPIAATPSTAEQAEGLKRLNVILAAVLGTEAGIELADLNVGGSCDQSAVIADYAPEDVRLVLNQTAARTVRLHPQPYEGQRIAIADGSGNLATYPVTLDGNGRRLLSGGNYSTTLALTAAAQFFYRADLGAWVQLTDLAATAEMPFPVEFDDYFVTRLAMRLNPRHSAAMDQLSAAAFSDAQQRLQARYRRPRLHPDMPTRGLLGGTLGDGSTAGFNRGRAW